MAKHHALSCLLSHQCVQWPTILSTTCAEIVELMRRDFAEHSGQPMVFNGLASAGAIDGVFIILHKNFAIPRVARSIQRI